MSDSNRDINAELLEAVKKGEFDKVTGLISEGADVKAKDDSENTALHWAASGGKKDVVEILLNKGANLNAQNDTRETPLNLADDKEIQTLLQSVKEDNDKLLEAAKNGNIGDVENLLNEEGKAQVNATDEDGNTPLHLAAQNGHKEIVKVLLSEGADVNALDTNLNNSLYWAVKNNHSTTAEVLLDNGADLHTFDPSRERDVLSRYQEIETEHSKNSLHLAAKLGNLEAVQDLLGKEANVNAQNDKGETPLHSAVEVCYVDIPYQHKDSNWYFPTERKCGNVKIVEALLGKKETNINAQDNSKKTPLHYATQNNNEKIVVALIKAGANINVKDKDGTTPFNLATDEKIKTLLQPAEESDPVDGSSTESEGVQEEEEEEEEEEKQVAEAKPGPDVIKKEDSEEESQRKQDINGEKGTDVTTGSAQPVAPTQNSVSSVGGSSTSNTAQTEEQPSSFFGSLFSILMKPFSLIASFFGGFFSWLFGSDEPIQSSSESDQPVVLESPNNSGDHDII